MIDPVPNSPSAKCDKCTTECGCCEVEHMQSQHEPEHECSSAEMDEPEISIGCSEMHPKNVMDIVKHYQAYEEPFFITPAEFAPIASALIQAEEALEKIHEFDDIHGNLMRQLAGQALAQLHKPLND